MSRYYLHPRDGTDELLDPDGLGIRKPAELRNAVLFNARDLIAGDVRDGLIDFRFRIDAEDESGEVFYSLPFAAAVNIILQTH